ncbi:MAG: hypothetical protein ACRELS_11620 [Candidatus Rokuibacteriota bacterium]
MRRSVVFVALGFALVVTAGPAFASSCPKLVAQINAATGQRFDPTAAAAKVKAQEGAALHAAGKHPESMKVLQEALASLGIK